MKKSRRDEEKEEEEEQRDKEACEGEEQGWRTKNTEAQHWEVRLSPSLPIPGSTATCLFPVRMVTCEESCSDLGVGGKKEAPRAFLELT